MNIISQSTKEDYCNNNKYIGEFCSEYYTGTTINSTSIKRRQPIPYVFSRNTTHCDQIQMGNGLSNYIGGVVTSSRESQNENPKLKNKNYDFNSTVGRGRDRVPIGEAHLKETNKTETFEGSYQGEVDDRESVITNNDDKAKRLKKGSEETNKSRRLTLVIGSDENKILEDRNQCIQKNGQNAMRFSKEILNYRPRISNILDIHSYAVKNTNIEVENNQVCNTSISSIESPKASNTSIEPPKVGRGRRKHGRAKRDVKKGKQTWTIAYNNMQGKTKNEKEMLQKLVRDNQWDVVCATETHIKEGQRKINFEGYNHFSKNRNPEEKKGGGISVWIKKKLIAYSIESEENNNEILWIEVAGSVKCIVGVVYLASRNNNNNEWNKDIMEILHRDITRWKTQNKEIILLGDFNGHIHVNDGGSQEIHSTNENGKLLLDLIKAHDLTMMNSSGKCKGKWTWMRANQKSVVDYVVTSQSEADISQSLVIDDTGKHWSIGSDHSWMVLTRDIQGDNEINSCQKVVPGIGKGIIRWKTENFDKWEIFRKVLHDKLTIWEDDCQDDIEVQNQIELGYKSIVKSLIDTADQVIKRKSGKAKNNPIKISRILKQRNKIAHAWRLANKRNNRQKSSKYWTEFLKTSKRCRKLKLRKQRKLFNTRWNSYAKNKVDMKKRWDILKSKNNEDINSISINNNQIHEPQDIVNEISKYMGNLGKEDRKVEAKVEKTNINKVVEQENEANLMESISLQEVIAAAKNMKRGKAQGPDNILTDFIIEGGDKLWEVMCRLFNIIIKNNYTPEDWGEEKTKLLHKKGAKSNLDNYRGISISNLGKLFTRILERRLNRVV